MIFYTIPNNSASLLIQKSCSEVNKSYTCLAIQVITYKSEHTSTSTALRLIDYKESHKSKSHRQFQSIRYNAMSQIATPVFSFISFIRIF